MRGEQKVKEKERESRDTVCVHPTCAPADPWGHSASRQGSMPGAKHKARCRQRICMCTTHTPHLCSSRPLRSSDSPLKSRSASGISNCASCSGGTAAGMGQGGAGHVVGSSWASCSGRAEAAGRQTQQTGQRASAQRSSTHEPAGPPPLLHSLLRSLLRTSSATLEGVGRRFFSSSNATLAESCSACGGGKREENERKGGQK